MEELRCGWNMSKESLQNYEIGTNMTDTKKDVKQNFTDIKH